MLRRDKLSTIPTSWSRAERGNAVGQPQKPSPPRRRIFNRAAPCPRSVLRWTSSVGPPTKVYSHTPPVVPIGHPSPSGSREDEVKAPFDRQSFVPFSELV